MREFFELLSRSEIPWLVIGGHALSLHGMQRDTVDLDCLIAAESTTRFTEYLVRHGFEETARHGSFARFRHASLIYPYLDIMEVDSIAWAKMFRDSRVGTLFACEVRAPSLAHLIALKLHAIRQDATREDKDRGDILNLLAANPGVVTTEELRALCERYAPPDFWDKLRAQIDR